MIVTVEIDGGVAVVTIDHPPVNALSQALRQALIETAEALDADPAVEAVVLICAGRTFIAGADLGEFGKPTLAPHLPDVIARIEGARLPWVAAIHGSALGGGLEVALGCHYRIAMPGAKLGLPEVNLGLIPGAGGTVRLPRLIGFEAAVDMVTSGKPVGAGKANALGLVDLLVDGADLRQAAIAFARDIATKPLPPLSRDRVAASPSEAFWKEQAQELGRRYRGQEAPVRALASLRNAAETDFESAMRHERATFLALRDSAEATALRHVFLAERAAPRPQSLEGVRPLPIRKTAVIGGGTMGTGIAAALLDAGLPVVLIERDQAALDHGLATLRNLYRTNVERGRLTESEAEARLAQLDGSTDYDVLSDVDLAIEAVFEKLDVKRAVFTKLQAACRKDAILATNTSYLDPAAIAKGLERPERFLGLHFFSPANVMKLLEIVPTRATSADVLATAFALARQLGKVPVQAGICDGFIGNRILKRYRAGAEALLLEGVSIEAVDAAMRSFGFAMGPFEAQDLGGLDIAFLQREAARANGQAIAETLCDRLVRAGRKGRKTGAGWYDYPDGSSKPQVSSTVGEILALPAGSRNAISHHQIAARLLDAMAEEGRAILEEQIAGSAADIDLVLIHGYGFPRWRGGPMHYAETNGGKGS
ncbi:3-hydroxyacyl-CoA dehydrogenase NAD-binding domain-containing protein [Rhizobium alvei]|uniref:3-hydroxyacyl-CoA dehydrogenase NAD-binding domain-containing protein n=1 Tax=Rhizobium alvei TaxID=1132659 RepID=A0ABT8YSC9_9HYPH|nr:3-hydroxyacyl-CoA dehydrogenase NAD-binding domain-containing protein [Rhizobium alvei]MDO6966664.1 3-hydroxyacyl-CoA dehydrogenase NAD-binding domain-containing protein [Rhizobium alvei]